MKRILSIALFLIGGPLSIAYAKTTMLGVRSDGTLYRLNPQTGETAEVGNTGLIVPNALAISPAGIAYTSNFAGPIRFGRVDMATGVITNIVASGFADIRDMAFVDNTLYGIKDGGAGNDQLVTIDEATGAVTVIGSMGLTSFQGLCAFGNSLYAWSTIKGLHTVDRATGATSDVNATVAGPTVQCMAFAPDGVLYGIDAAGTAYRVDRFTGNTTALGSFGDTRGLAALPRSYRLLMRPAVGSTGFLPSLVLDTGTLETVEESGPTGTSNAGTGRPHSSLLFGSGVTLARMDPGDGGFSAVGNMTRQYRGFASMGPDLYGVGSSTEGLYSINPNTGADAFIGLLGFNHVEGLAGLNGQLYGWDTTAGLVRINKTTGVATDVNALIAGTTGIQSLEATPDGTLFGVGDKLYAINPATGSFLPRGGNWPTMIGSSAYISEDADLIAVTQAGVGHTVDRQGISTGSLWSTGIGAWFGLRFADDGYTYMTNASLLQLLRLNPTTGATTVVAATPPNPRGLSWYDGDLFVAHPVTTTRISRFDPFAGAFSPLFNMSYTNGRDMATAASGAVFQNDSITGLHRVDLSNGTDTDLGGSVSNVEGLEILPDQTMVGCAAVHWYQLDPTTGEATDIPSAQTWRGTAYVGKQLNANLTLGDYLGDYRNQVVTIEYRHRGSTVPVEARRVRLSADGSFHVATFQKGAYDITVKASHWLRKTLSPSQIGDGISVVFGTLVNGDIDGDNEVAIGDYSQLSTAFNSAPGDPDWNPNADLNGDDGVDIGDYSILSANFGAIGDD